MKVSVSSPSRSISWSRTRFQFRGILSLRISPGLHFWWPITAIFLSAVKGYQKRSRNHAVNYQFWPKSRKVGQILGDNKTARRIDDETARRNFLKRKSRNNWTFGEIIFLLSKFFRYCRFVLQTVEIFLTMAKYFQQWDFAKLYNFYPLKSTIPTRIIVLTCMQVSLLNNFQGVRKFMYFYNYYY